MSRCHACKRTFKNHNELDLHMKAHSYARHLGKYRLARSEAEAAKTVAAEAKVITTVGTKDKKILRKYTKNRANLGVLTRKREASKETSKIPLESDQPKQKSVPKLTLSLTVPRTPPLSAGYCWGDMRTPLSRTSASIATSGQQFSCDICDKSFIVRSLYRRHMKHKHGVEPQVNIFKLSFTYKLYWKPYQKQVLYIII